MTTRSEHPEVRVRPYLITGGRTRGDLDLPLETQLLRTPASHEAAGTLATERLEIVELCTTYQSLAEVSALLELNLAVTRVLVSDLVQEDLLGVHSEAGRSATRPDVRLLQRVLNGLQSL